MTVVAHWFVNLGSVFLVRGVRVIMIVLVVKSVSQIPVCLNLPVVESIPIVQMVKFVTWHSVVSASMTLLVVQTKIVG